MKKLHMGQNLLIAVLAIATLFFALLLVLSLIPANTDVRIQREIEVSSFEVEASETSDSEWRYLVTAEGSLRNTTDQELIVERIVIPVSNDSFNNGKSMELQTENIVLPPMTEVDITVQGEGDADYRFVGEVTAVVNGQELFLRNPADTELAAILVPLMLTCVFAFSPYRPADAAIIWRRRIGWRSKARSRAGGKSGGTDVILPNRHRTACGAGLCCVGWIVFARPLFRMHGTAAC